MSLLNLKVFTSRPDSYIEKNFQTPGGNRTILQRVIDYLQRIVSGNEIGDGVLPPSVSISLDGPNGAARASGSFTFLNVVATDVFSINGVDFTCVASGATGNQFNVGVDDEETVQNAMAAVNGSVTALVKNYVTARATATTLFIDSNFYGLSGNQTTIATADATITPSGSRLTGGTQDAGELILNF